MTLARESPVLLAQEPTVNRYFESFNQGDFETTASLFATGGQLLPPFEEPIVGPIAIRDYLQQEAEGMAATPKVVSEEAAGDRRRVIVRGTVKALMFAVNAAWVFDLNPDNQIEQVQVKLLASLQDLLKLRA
jgi:hypothetical protein